MHGYCDICQKVSPMQMEKKSKAKLGHSYLEIVFSFKTVPEGNTGLAVYSLSARSSNNMGK